MNRGYKLLNEAATNPWFMVASGASAMAAFLLFHSRDHDTVAGKLVIALVFIVLAFGYLYSAKVRAENISLRSLSDEFFDINRIYQRTMQQTFLTENPRTDPETLIQIEKETLEGVSQRIARIFERVTGRKCMVTVKLITYENGAYYAHTYVRSLRASVRDQSGLVRYEVASGENTAFRSALRPRDDDKPPHFFSPDLASEQVYRNQRKDFIRHYRSALVVPIMNSNAASGDSPDQQDMPQDPNLIGFLCVDTMSINRLNDTFHLVMLSALASQMFTFMCLMRGRYVAHREG